MNRHEFEIYIELYKRKQFSEIPIGEYSKGEYFYCTKKQIKALELISDDTTTQVGYGGAARSGKTIIEATAVIFDCYSYNGIAWGLARKELTTLKRTVLITLFKQFAFYGLKKDIDYNYNQQLNKITFSNGSEIFLIDTAYQPSDPLHTRFGGFELTRCAIDESNETEKAIVDKIFERTGWRLNDVYGLKRKTFECFNPAKNHVYTRFYHPFRDNKESEHIKFIQALPSDNPHPSVKEWIEDMLKTADNVTIQRQIYGNFEYDDNPYAMFDYSDILGLFTNEYIKRNGERFLTADIAYEGSDKFVIGVWDGLVLIKIIAIDKIDETLVSKKIHELRIEYSVPLKNVVYDADGLKTFVRESANSGHLNGAVEFHNGASPVRVDGRAENFFNLKAQCYFYLAELTKKSKIFIEEKQYRKQIIEELEQICKLPLTDDGKIRLEKKDAIKERLGRSPDFADMLMMRMWFELKDDTEIETEWD